MKHLESIQQAQVIEWSKWAYKANPSRYPMLNMLHCSLNGVKLSGTQAKVAKGQGMLSGLGNMEILFGIYITLYLNTWVEQMSLKILFA